MKKIIYILISFVSLLLLVSCEKEFDANKYFGKSKTILNFVPSNDYDTTYLYVQATTPLNESKTPVKTSVDYLMAKVNGQEIPLTYAGSTGEFGSECYYTTYKFSAGDKVEVESALSDHEKVDGKCVVPKPFPEYTYVVRRELVDGYYDTCFDINYDNSLSNTGYYGVELVVETHSVYQSGKYNDQGEVEWDPARDTVTIASANPSVTNDMIIAGGGQAFLIVYPSSYNGTFTRIRKTGDDYYYSHYASVLAWDDVPEKSGEKGFHQLRVSGGYIDSEEERDYDALISWNPDGTYETERRRSKSKYEHRFKLRFYAFSQEYYSKLKSDDNKSNNDFAELGLAPAAFTYTNINNGLGVCGSYMVSETDWFKLDKDNL